MCQLMSITYHLVILILGAPSVLSMADVRGHLWRDNSDPLTLSQPVKPVKPEKHKTTINLALFCDRDIGQKLKWQEQEIRSYWEAVMFDVHPMFQTLPDFDIRFQVTSLSVES